MSYNTGSKVTSSPSIDERQSSLYIGTEQGDLYSLDLRDGLKKWDIETGSAINSTPTIFGNNIAVGTASGSTNIYDKFTGNQVWNFNPGYIPNISGSISASTVASGSSLFVASEDGNIYSLNTDQKVGPTSTYLYYYVAAIIILIGVGLSLIHI